MPEISHVMVLDMDDTLYLEFDYMTSGFYAIEEYLAQKVGDFPFAHSALEEYRKKPDLTVIDRTLNALNIDPRHSQELIQIYRDHLPKINLCPDVVPFFDSLPESVGTALISDGRLQGQKNKVKALGLDRYIERIILTDQWGKDYWKPHPKAFEEVEAHFQLPPGNHLMYVGDNPKKDFKAPGARNWRTAMIKRPGGLYDQTTELKQNIDFNISSLLDIDIASFVGDRPI